MTLNELYKKDKTERRPSERKIEVTVRVTNPRTRQIIEFGIPTISEGIDENVQQECFQRLADFFEKWGFEPPCEKVMPDDEKQEGA